MKVVNVDNLKRSVRLIGAFGDTFGNDVTEAIKAFILKQIENEPVIEAIPIKFIENYAYALRSSDNEKANAIAQMINIYKKQYK